METIIYVALALQTLGNIAFLVKWRLGRAERLETIRDAVEARKMEAATAATSADLAKTAEVLTSQLESAVGEAKEQEARYMRLFTTVEVVVAERDQWRELAHTARTGHAAAQDMMLREIARLCKLTGREPQKELKDMVDEYRADLTEAADNVKPAPHPHQAVAD